MWNLITVIAFIECSLNTWFFLACCIHINACPNIMVSNQHFTPVLCGYL